MKRIALLAVPFFMMSSANAAEIRSIITDSVQLTVDGPAIQSNRIGSQYSVSGSNISVTTLGGLTGGSPTAPQTIGGTSYDIATDGQAFTFSETSLIGDTQVNTQNQISTNGRFADPNLYGDTLTYSGGSSGDLAGTLTPTSVPTVTAGGPGTTAIGQRSIELTVFQ